MSVNKPSGNEVRVASRSLHKETYYFKPGADLPPCVPDPNARWTRQHEIPISPCLETRSSPEHTWEVLLRCTRCGMLIRLENTPHPIDQVRANFRAAYERIRSWLDSVPSFFLS